MTDHIEEARGAWCASSGYLDRSGKCRNPDGCVCEEIGKLNRALAAAEERGRMAERGLAQKVINEMGRIVGNLQAELDKGKTP